MKKVTIIAMAMVLALCAFSVKSANADMWVEGTNLGIYYVPDFNTTNLPYIDFLRADNSAKTSRYNFYQHFWAKFAFMFGLSNQETNETIDVSTFSGKTTFKFNRISGNWFQVVIGGTYVVIAMHEGWDIEWYHLMFPTLFPTIHTEYLTVDLGNPVTTTTTIPGGTTTTTTPATTTIPSACPLVSINNAVVQLLEGYMIDGQLNFNNDWYYQYPNAQNQVTLNCTYSGEWLEFSVCSEADPTYCPEPCDNDYRINTDDPNHNNWHYGYTCP